MPHSESPEHAQPSDHDNEVLPDAAPTDPQSDSNGNDNATTNQAGGVKLEDLFNDDDDEEFPTSSAPDTKMEEPSSAPEPVA